jgi:hypothetical protein
MPLNAGEFEEKEAAATRILIAAIPLLNLGWARWNLRRAACLFRSIGDATAAGKAAALNEP